jgi:hypothetical protein
LRGPSIGNLRIHLISVIFFIQYFSDYSIKLQLFHILIPEDMDPFSITVGALGITGFALSSMDHLRDLIGSLADAKEVVQDIALTLEAIQRPLTSLERLTISDHVTYAEAKSDLENTGVAEAVNRCGQACADFTRKLQQWTKHSNNSKLSLQDRLSVGVWNKEKIRTFRTQVLSCQAIVQFAIESTQL